MTKEANAKNVTSRTSLATREIGKLLPTEATAAFLSVKAMIDLSEHREDKYAALFLLGVIVLITLVTPWAARVLLEVKNAKHRWVLAVSFAIWACNIEFSRLVALVPTNKIIVELAIPGALLLWSTLFLPILLDVFRPGGGFHSKDEEQQNEEGDAKDPKADTDKQRKAPDTDKGAVAKNATDKSASDKKADTNGTAQSASGQDKQGKNEGVGSERAKKLTNEAEKPATPKDN